MSRRRGPIVSSRCWKMSPKSPSASSRPRLSVIMPVFNGAAFLAEALASVRAQTVPVFEVIVVDDGSTDESAEIAARHSFVTLIRGEHGGIAATLNRGLEAATGDFLSFLDQDDRWLPQKNFLQSAAFHRDHQLDLVFGHIRRFRSEPKMKDVTLDVLPGVSKLSLMIRRASFDRVGHFSTDGPHDFLDWYCRAQEAGLRGMILPEVLAERRIHADNFGVRHRDRENQSYLAALKASLDRRRAAQRSVNGSTMGSALCPADRL